MTACTNHGGKARRVVTAALVGVLSVGTVPMAALAEGVSDGIQTLALSASEAFKNGEMTEARDSEGRMLDIPADGIVTVEKGNWIVPTQIKPVDSDPVDIYIDGYNSDSAHANADLYYDGDAVASLPDSTQTGVGPHKVEVKMRNGFGYDGATFTCNYIVEDAKDLSNATLFDKSNGATNVSDTTFTYNGSAQQIGVAVDGKVATGYTMTIDKRLDANGKADVQNGLSQVIDAGTYIANITDTAKGAVVAKVTFRVNQVNLSTAKVSVSDVDSVNYTTDTVKTVYVDGVPFNADATAGVKLVDTLAEVTSGQTGASSVIVTPNVAANNNIVGSATVQFNVVDDVLTDATYNGTVSFSANGRNTNGLTINLADGESFKPERIEVKDGTDPIDASYFTVSYTDANDNEVDASALSTPGTYYVTVRVNAAASHFQYGSGDITMKVVVTNGIVTDKDIVFKFDGKVGDTFTPTYDGTDQLEKLETIVHTKWGDDLVAGTDYTVTVHNDDTDEDVDSIVDAGNYTVTLNIPGYIPTVSGDNTCKITVDQLNLDTVWVNGGDLDQYTYEVTHGSWPFQWTSTETVWYLGYTGEDLEPSFELGYYTGKDGEVADAADVNTINADPSDYTWHALTTEEIEVTGYTNEDGKSVDAMNAKGDYEVRFALNSKNYTTTAKATSNVITVSDAKVGFVDVSADAWYAQGVFDAKQLGYVKGVSGTDMYAPESSISRADALIIISRMAGFDQTVNAEDYLAENGGFLTRYTDVDKGAYYAKAVAWGTKMGIVNGYGDGSTFGPNDPITREQFAAMLANYAKATGDYSTPSDDALAGIADADTVDAWATDAVAWAVENGVMGNGGYVYGRNEISRAEVACMAVNYQPDGASSDVIG